MRHSRVVHAVLAVLCVLTTSCTDSVEPPASPTFKVALLSPGPVSDAGWNALAYEGLLAIRDQLGRHPAAERILRNMLRYAAQETNKPPAELPADFPERLKSMGYSE